MVGGEAKPPIGLRTRVPAAHRREDQNRHDDMAISTAMTAVVPAAQENDTAWLLSVASPDERAISLQTRAAVQDAAHDAIGRCATIIKDSDANIYRRGMAVLALGRTLGRELGRPQSRYAILVRAVRQVRYCSPLHTGKNNLTLRRGGCGIVSN